jgi:hypothetical protein
MIAQRTIDDKFTQYQLVSTISAVRVDGLGGWQRRNQLHPVGRSVLE